jgi:hypothetical protein
MKSFRAKDGSDEPPSGGRNGERDFHGERRSNDTHASATDPEARLYRKGKGKEAKLSYISDLRIELIDYLCGRVPGCGLVTRHKFADGKLSHL